MPIAATERTLRAILQYGIDPRGLREVTQGTDELQDALDELRQHAMAAAEPWQDLGAIISQYEALGSEFAMMGQQVSDTIRGWAEEYIAVTGEADEVSQMWLETTKELETAQARLGGVAIKALVPLIEATAGVVDKAADLAEKYPEAMQVALGIGTAIVAAAAIQSAVTRGIRIYADAKLLIVETQRLLAAKMMKDAANKQLAAAVQMGAASKERALLGMGGAAGKAGGVGGALAAAAPALAIGAAVVAVGAAGVAVKRFAEDVKSKTGEMGNHWDVFLTKSTGEVENATDLASRYKDAQANVNRKFDEGGVLAATFLDRQGLVNASQSKVQQSLVQVAKDHADYERAIDSLNSNLALGAEGFFKLEKAAFDQRKEMNKLWQTYREGNATLRDVAAASSGVQRLMLGLAASMQDAVSTTKLIEPWNEFLAALEDAAKAKATELEQLDAEHNAEMVKMDIETAAEREAIAAEYDAAVLALDLDTASKREDILERQEAAVIQAETDIGRERVTVMSSFQDDMAEMEADHYAARAEAAADYGIEVARAEQDHQKTMRRMQEDSADRQRSAIRSRDALGLLEEVRSYQKDRGRAEEDYRIEAARRSQDFARQLAQMEVSFQEQLGARQKAYQDELAALQVRLNEEKRVQDEQASQELEALDEARQVQIRDIHDHLGEQETALTDSHAKQESDLATTLRNQQMAANNAHATAVSEAQNRWDKERQARGVFLTGELSELNAHYQERLASLRDWMNQAQLVVRPTAGAAPQLASGGYSAGPGLHMLGERGREFVLDAPTTRRAEAAAGGNLSQGRLLAAMAGGGRAFPPVNMSFQFGGVSDPTRIMAMVKQGTLETMEQVLRNVR